MRREEEPGEAMKREKQMRIRPWILLVIGALGCLLTAGNLRAQEPAAPDAMPHPGTHERKQGIDDGGPLPTFGRITAIHANAIHITDINGADVTIKVTAQTEFRKDRLPVALKDFKVGDGILVRGEENPDHSVIAKMVAGRSGTGGPNGGRGGGNGRGLGGGPMGTLGKDFVVGEVQSIDAPSIALLRTDNVKQTIELNEETSLRKGQDSVTMADIQVGDHIFARGALQENKFVPKSVIVIAPEQWKRVKEMEGSPASAGKPASADSKAKTPAGPPN